MPYAMNDEVEIRYEVEGSGEPLVMMHGATIGLETWQELGYTDALRDEYQLILIDARAHGQSGKPHDPEQYRPEAMVGDVVAVLDDLGIEKAHYVGASLGAAIGFEMARHAPDRLRSLVLMGYGKYGPLTEAQQQFVMMGLHMFEAGAAMGGEAVLAAIEGQGAAVSPAMRAAYKANDWHALLAMQRAFVEWPGFEEVLPGVSVPAALVITESDPFYPSAMKCAETMPRARFITLADGAHNQNSYTSGRVVPHIKAVTRGAI